ncbi:phage Gp37/Gp68 family protein [Streptomyces sp. MnatMP-M17]|uniref:DUF5131 family protein n=1 Tax=unclassified Streptomyces TaxID=2593676 RepID=UPI00081E924E|nr:phage Gp37/Gp68 family protein [Streptomyces sp. MnatMP-M17]MYZ34343.1 DUF5131 family protein [Streptomyces sp. SID4917]SCF66597.1 protein gp37 [Streptomyces sp. MnatMP-M17]
MSDTTTIEWTEATWNPVTGCTKVSPGCDHCYAETFAERWRGTPGHHFENGFDIQLRPERLLVPLRWKKPRRIFVNSMSDLFHDKVPDEHIARVFAVMALTPQHTYQVLTKRHGRMRALLSSFAFRQACEEAASAIVSDDATPVPQYRRDAYMRQWWSHFAKPLPNVWLGVSVEDQKRADIRIPALLDTPAAVRFLSCEPLLGPVDLFGLIVPGRGRPKLTYWLDGRPGWGAPHTTSTGLQMQSMETGPRIDWVIAGGESGRGARPAHPDWFRTLRDQCAHSNVPYFFKQWGEWAPTGALVIRNRPVPGSELVGDPVDNRGHRIEMRRIGKKAAGRALDGRHHDAFPATIPR